MDAERLDHRQQAEARGEPPSSPPPSLLHSNELLNTIDGLDPNHRADLLAAIRYDSMPKLQKDLRSIGYHGQIVSRIGKLPHDLRTLLLADTQFLQELTASEQLDRNVEAGTFVTLIGHLHRANDPSASRTEKVDGLVWLAAYQTFLLSQWRNLGPVDFDRQCAKVARAIYSVPRGDRATLFTNEIFSGAAATVRSSDWGAASIRDALDTMLSGEVLTGLEGLAIQQHFGRDVFSPRLDCNAEWVALTLAEYEPFEIAIGPSPSERVRLKLDAQAAMRLAAVQDDADADWGLSDHPTGGRALTFYRRVRDLLWWSIMNVGNRDADRIRNVLFGQPSYDPRASRFEREFIRRQLANGEWRRAANFAPDALSNSGPEFDEALVRLDVRLHRLGDRDPDVFEWAEIVVDYCSLRERADDYQKAKSQIADWAVAGATTVTAVAITVATGGAAAPLSAVMMTAARAAVGAGIAAVTTRAVIEGVDASPDQLGRDLASALAEGGLDALGGGLIGVGGRYLMGRAAMEAVGAQIAGALQRRGLSTAQVQLLARVTGALTEGALEGVASGVLIAGAETALDHATWDQAQHRVIGTFITRMAGGALFGVGFGVGGGLLAVLTQEVGSALAQRYLRILERSQLRLAAEAALEHPDAVVAIKTYIAGKEQGLSPTELRATLIDRLGTSHPVVEALNPIGRERLDEIEAELYRTIVLAVDPQRREAAFDALSRVQTRLANANEITEGMYGEVRVRGDQDIEVVLYRDGDGLDVREEFWHVVDVATLTPEDRALLLQEQLTQWNALGTQVQRRTWRVVSDIELRGLDRTIGYLDSLAGGLELAPPLATRRAELLDRRERWRQIRKRLDEDGIIPDGAPRLRSGPPTDAEGQWSDLLRSIFILEGEHVNYIIRDSSSFRTFTSRRSHSIKEAQNLYSTQLITLLDACDTLTDASGAPVNVRPADGWVAGSFRSRALRLLRDEDQEVLFDIRKSGDRDVISLEPGTKTRIQTKRDAIVASTGSPAAREFFRRNFHATDWGNLHAETHFVIKFLTSIIDSGVEVKDLKTYLQGLDGTMRIQLTTPSCFFCYYGLNEIRPARDYEFPPAGAIPHLSRLMPGVRFEISANRGAHTEVIPLGPTEMWTDDVPNRVFAAQQRARDAGFLLIIQNGGIVD